jgi:competence protein ComEC
MRLKARLAAIACLAALYAVSAIPERNFELSMLDVGQGEASVIRLPGGRHIMIDTGGLPFFDIGENIDVPYLAAHSIGKLDFVILTHAHPDHAGGIAAIARSVPVDEIWRNSEPDRLYRELGDVPIRVVGAGFRHDGDGYSIEVLHPSHEFLAALGRRKADDRKNVSSLVLKLTTGRHSILFASDIDAETERLLVEQYGATLRANVLKIAHHGSKRSSSPEFLDVVRPRIALISAGRHNPFHHPHDETIARIQASGAAIYRTDIDGAIVIDENDGIFRVRTCDDFRMHRAARLRDEWRNLGIMLWFG